MRLRSGTRKAARPRAAPHAPDQLVAGAQRRLLLTTLLVLGALLSAVGITTAVFAERQLDASVDRTLEAAALAELERLHEAATATPTPEPTSVGAREDPGDSEETQATGQPTPSDAAGSSGKGDGADDDEGAPTQSPVTIASPPPTRVRSPLVASAVPTAAGTPRAASPPPTPDLDDRRPSAADTFFLYLDTAGEVVQNPERITLAGLPNAEAATSAALIGRDLRTVRAGDVRVRLLTLPVPADDDVMGKISMLQAGFVLKLRDEQMDALLRAIVLVALGGLLAAAAISVLLTRRFLVPVRAAFDRERRFVAAASHELRTPLALIRSSAEVLSREGRVTPEGERLVGDIVAESDRMAGLVADLSELSLLQARPPSALGPVDLAAVADDVVHRATAMAESAGVRLETAAGVPGHAVIVRGDRDRIVQVALILLDNTIRHSPRGSTVHVAVTPVRGGGELSVADQGPGIAPADRERIFEPFARLASATDRSEGSGLGLAIARAIVSGMSGRIRVADAAGGGALFTVTLPSV